MNTSVMIDKLLASQLDAVINKYVWLTIIHSSLFWMKNSSELIEHVFYGSPEKHRNKNIKNRNTKTENVENY